MPGDDDFSIEGYSVKNDKLDTLEFCIEYDYHDVSRKGAVLTGNSTKNLSYRFPLGFRVNTKGTFKFRIRFFNGYNYVPVDDYKYYFSNWIYLTIK